MYRYEIVQMDPAAHECFGILGRQNQGGIWLPVVVSAPFSSNREIVSKLAERCTACQLLPEHLIDVVIDFISQTAMPT